MEEEAPPVVHLDVVLDVQNLHDDLIAGAARLAGAVARPDLAGHIVRESAGQDPGPDERPKVAPLLPDQRATSYPEDGR